MRASRPPPFETPLRGSSGQGAPQHEGRSKFLLILRCCRRQPRRARRNTTTPAGLSPRSVKRGRGAREDTRGPSGKSVGWPGKASRAVMSCRPVQASYGTAGFRQPRRTRSRAAPDALGLAGASRRVSGGCLRRPCFRLPASRTLAPLPVLRDIPVPPRFRSSGAYVPAALSPVRFVTPVRLEASPPAATI